MLNSIITTSKNIYSSYKAYGRLKKTARSLMHAAGPLERILQLTSRKPEVDPESILGEFESISDDLLEVLSNAADALTTPETGRRNKPPSNNDREVRPVEENP